MSGESPHNPPVANVIKLFTAVSYDNKLERLFLAKF
jgi:hypothetical protein